MNKPQEKRLSCNYLFLNNIYNKFIPILQEISACHA